MNKLDMDSIYKEIGVLIENHMVLVRVKVVWLDI